MASGVIILPTTQMMCDLLVRIPAWAWGILLCFEGVRCFSKAQKLESFLSELDGMHITSISEAISVLHHCGMFYSFHTLFFARFRSHHKEAA
jgi:hypothetical protein